MEHDACEQDDTRANLDDEIAQAGEIGPLCAPCPDEEDRRDGGPFPEDKEGDEVACKDGSNGGTCVKEGADLLHGVANVPCVDEADKGGE